MDGRNPLRATLKPLGNHGWLVFTRESPFQGESSGGAGFCPSTVGVLLIAWKSKSFTCLGGFYAPFTRETHVFFQKVKLAKRWGGGGSENASLSRLLARLFGRGSGHGEKVSPGHDSQHSHGKNPPQNKTGSNFAQFSRNTRISAQVKSEKSKRIASRRLCSVKSTGRDGNLSTVTRLFNSLTAAAGARCRGRFSYASKPAFSPASRYDGCEGMGRGERGRSSSSYLAFS